MGGDVTIVYMVAGMSSRFNGKVKQFAMIGPNGETLIEYSLNQALKAGFNKIVFIVGDKTEVGFKEMFGDEYMGVPVFYARQEFDSDLRTKPWGTVDALCCARNFIDTPFVVCNGDDIYGEESFKIVFDAMQKGEDGVTVGFKLDTMLSDTCTVNRGIFRVNEDNYLTEMKEFFNIEMSNLDENNLGLDELCNVNLFGFRPDVIDMLDARLKEFKKKYVGTNDECLLTTELSELMMDGSVKILLHSTPDRWMGVTGPEDTEIVRKAILSQLV